MAMSQRDRDALRAVVKGRFEVLSGELTRRWGHLRNQVASEVKAEFADLRDKYDNEMEVLEEQARELVKESRKLSLEAERKGIIIGRYGRDELLTINVDRTITIREENTLINERFNAIISETKANQNLRELELKIIEEILTSDMGEDARGLLDRIPSIDDLLPLPEAAKKTRKAIRK